MGFQNNLISRFLNLITYAKSLLLHKVVCSQVTGSRTWTFGGSSYSVVTCYSYKSSYVLVRTSRVKIAIKYIQKCR